MKKLALFFSLFMSLFIFNNLQTKAIEDAVYPFDSITITDAYKFEITVNEVPDGSVVLKDVTPGEVLTVYVGELKFMYNGEESSGSNSIIIVTNSSGIDLARCLDNSGSAVLDSEGNFTGAYYTQYSSHITIDPNIGVIKLGSEENPYSLTIYKTETNEYRLIDDNTGVSFVMNPGSFEEKLDVNEVISVNEELQNTPEE